MTEEGDTEEASGFDWMVYGTIGSGKTISLNEILARVYNNGEPEWFDPKGESTSNHHDPPTETPVDPPAGTDVPDSQRVKGQSDGDSSNTDTNAPGGAGQGGD